MATSLENLGNEFEITNHENTTMTEKMKVWCIWLELWQILCNFGYEIQNSVAMATSLVYLSNITEIYDRRFKNVEYALHTIGVFTKFM